MGATTKISLNPSFWQQIAVGVANVTMTALSGNAQWVINSATTQPTLKQGHTLATDENLSLALAAGEYLFVLGNADVIYTVS